MGRIAGKRLWSRHNVPMEMWSEILVRLPVRSLVRFRCVSRSWKVLIDDPDFCQEHVVRFKNNCDETHLMMVHGGCEQHCFVRRSNTMKTSRSLGCLGVRDQNTGEYKSTAIPGFNGIWCIRFSVDGIVMLKCVLRSLNPKLMLWNPSIRKYRLVPHSHDTEFRELGLGFDPLIKDYKLVRITRRNTDSVDIYTIGTGSWRTVPAAQGTVMSIGFQRSKECKSVYFKGCLYIRSKTELISFDLSREVFKSVDLPRYGNSAPKYPNELLALVDGGSSLALLHLPLSGVNSIWVLDDNDDALSWTMRCTFTMRVPCFLYLKKNGDLLFDRLMYSKAGVVSCNIYTEEQRQTNYKQRTMISIYGYKESLVLLK